MYGAWESRVSFLEREKETVDAMTWCVKKILKRGKRENLRCYGIMGFILREIERERENVLYGSMSFILGEIEREKECTV